MSRTLLACLLFLALANAAGGQSCWNPNVWPTTNHFRSSAGATTNVYLYIHSANDVIASNQYVGVTQVVNVVTMYMSALAAYDTDYYAVGPLPSAGDGFSFQPREHAAQQLAEAVLERDLCATDIPINGLNPQYNPVYYRRAGGESNEVQRANEYGRLLDFKDWLLCELDGDADACGFYERSHLWTRIPQASSSFSTNFDGSLYWNQTNLPAQVGLPYNWAYWTPWRGLFDGALAGPSRQWYIRTNYFLIWTNDLSGTNQFCFDWADERGAIHTVCGSNRQSVSVVWTNWADASSFDYTTDQLPGHRQGEYGYDRADDMLNLLTDFVLPAARYEYTEAEGVSEDIGDFADPPGCYTRVPSFAYAESTLLLATASGSGSPSGVDGMANYTHLYFNAGSIDECSWDDAACIPCGQCGINPAPHRAHRFRRYAVSFGLPSPAAGGALCMKNGLTGEQLTYTIEIYARAYRLTGNPSTYWGGSLFPQEGTWYCIYSGPAENGGASNPLTPTLDVADEWAPWPAAEPDCPDGDSYNGFQVRDNDVYALVRVTGGWCYITPPGAPVGIRVVRFGVPVGVQSVTITGLNLTGTPTALQATVHTPTETSARMFAIPVESGATSDRVTVNLSGRTTEPGFAVVLMAGV